MDLFDLGRLLHSLAGTIALVAFWTAFVSGKGSARHKASGRIYLRALIVVMGMSALMVAGRALHGDIGGAIYLIFLISIVGTASWLMLFAMRSRRDPARLSGWVYRGLATWLIVAGAGVFSLGVARGAPLMMFLSALGVAFGGNMWRLALQPTPDAKWWLGQHINGVALNFIATHDSFLALGLGSVVSELRAPVPRMMIAVTLAVLAVGGRWWLARPRRPSLPDRGLTREVSAAGLPLES